MQTTCLGAYKQLNTLFISALTKLVHGFNPNNNCNKNTNPIKSMNLQYKDDSANKAEFDRLRAIEAEESKLFESMTKQSDIDKRLRIDQEIAESRANRWSTF